MLFDWQTIAVALIVAAAFFYVARRGLARLRSFRAGAKAGGVCETGCGKCGGEVDSGTKSAKILVQIGRLDVDAKRGKVRGRGEARVRPRESH
jgi:hypothetical protein